MIRADYSDYLSYNAAVVSGCTSGFMELDILRKRAEKIPGDGTSDQGLNGEFRLLPNESFSCNGTMTGLLLVGTYRDVFLIKSFPLIEIWRNTGGNTYTRQARQEIRLAEGDFGPDGVLQYSLTTPLSYQSGDVLGVFQPLDLISLVRVYYNQGLATTYRLNAGDPTSLIDLQDLSSVSNQQILISPVSGKSSILMTSTVNNAIFVDSPCTGNFLSHSALRQGALNVNINDVRRRDNQQRLFPDITFTCNGSITKWIVGVGTENSDSLPELQIWQNIGKKSYTKAKFSLIPSNAIFNNNVAEYTLSTPLEFQEGDILGVYQPRQQNSALVVYYQERDGPVNYEEGDNSLSTVTLGSSDNQYDYPLVTVEISTQGNVFYEAFFQTCSSCFPHC